MSELLKAGEKAPDFTLPCRAVDAAGDEEPTFTLSNLRGKNVVLAFYPADWSAVCGDQLALYNELLPVFAKYDAELFGVSVDSEFSHEAFRKDRGYKMMLLSDFEPKGEVAKKYGVYDEKNGFCKRAIFVIDKTGVIRYSYVSPIDVNPGADQILKTLKEIEGEEQGGKENGK